MIISLFMIEKGRNADDVEELLLKQSLIPVNVSIALIANKVRIKDKYYKNNTAKNRIDVHFRAVSISVVLAIIDLIITSMLLYMFYRTNTWAYNDDVKQGMKFRH